MTKFYFYERKFVSWVPKSLDKKIPIVKMVQNNENKEKKLKILRWVFEIQFDQFFDTLLRVSLYGGYLKLLTLGPQKLFRSKLVLKNKN